MALKVLVVGAGIGGLGLAQGLRRAGVDVRVYERQSAAGALGQPSRIRIDEHGVRALSRCLPPDLMELFRASSNPVGPLRAGVFDHQLAPLAAPTERAADPAHASAVSNDRTLREVLLAGLGDVVEFGRAVVDVGDKGDHVVLHFADGVEETGDLLVAADGVDSTVRARLLPGAELVDTGLRGISGQATFDADLARRLPEPLLGGSSPILGPDGLTLVIGVYRPGTAPQQAAAAIAPYARLSPVSAHVKWTLVGPVEAFARTDEELGAASRERLVDIARRITGDWSPALAETVARSQAATTTLLRIRAALAVPSWPAGRITFLGDAIHPTTAVGGNGACVALRDAALLTELLDAGPADPLTAVASYEQQLREYGATAALRSLHAAERLFRVCIPALG